MIIIYETICYKCILNETLMSIVNFISLYKYFRISNDTLSYGSNLYKACIHSKKKFLIEYF